MPGLLKSESRAEPYPNLMNEFTPMQLQRLREKFAENSNPSVEHIRQIAQEIRLPYITVKLWFHAQRHKPAWLQRLTPDPADQSPVHSIENLSTTSTHRGMSSEAISELRSIGVDSILPSRSRISQSNDQDDDSDEDNEDDEDDDQRSDNTSQVTDASQETEVSQDGGAESEDDDDASQKSDDASWEGGADSDENNADSDEDNADSDEADNFQGGYNGFEYIEGPQDVYSPAESGYGDDGSVSSVESFIGYNSVTLSSDEECESLIESLRYENACSPLSETEDFGSDHDEDKAQDDERPQDEERSPVEEHIGGKNVLPQDKTISNEDSSDDDCNLSELSELSASDMSLGSLA